MKATENIDTIGQTVPALRTAGRVAMVAVLAAIIFLAVWPPTSAEVTQINSNLPASKQNDPVQKSDQLVRDYSEWLSAAHRKAGVSAQEQPLPAQF